MDRLSVEIVTFNRPMELAVCLSSLLRQSYKDFDLVIIDDSVRPSIGFPAVAGLLSQFRLEKHGVKYVHNDLRKGIAAARNQAVRESFPSELHVRLDDDSFCEPDYLLRLVRGFTGHVNVGAVGGVVPMFGGSKVYRNADLVNVFNEITWKDGDFSCADDGGFSWFSKSGVNIKDSHHLRSSFLFTKEVWDAVGGFPEEYGIINAFREETDFCMKVKMLGKTLLTDINAVAWHARAMEGGARGVGYAESVVINDEHFHRKFKRFMKLGKIPKEAFTVVE